MLAKEGESARLAFRRFAQEKRLDQPMIGDLGRNKKARSADNRRFVDRQMRSFRLIEPLDQAKSRHHRLIALLVANKTANHRLIALRCFVQMRDQPVIGRLARHRLNDQRLIAGLATRNKEHRRLPVAQGEDRTGQQQPMS